MRKIYDKSFYIDNIRCTKTSADTFSELIIEAVKPKSAVDLGCATGLFLAALKSRGINDILGMDGQWVNEEQLLIPKESFNEYDLTKDNLNISRRFDVAICLEMGEHVEKEYADKLVDSLVNLSDVVWFSAAIPRQGGLHHVNEQWQSYWAEKFAAKGYLSIDYVRRQVWNSKEVNQWYKQNTIVYVKVGSLKNFPKLKEEYDANPKPILDVVHPDVFNSATDAKNVPWRVVYKSAFYYKPKRALPYILSKIRGAHFGAN